MGDDGGPVLKGSRQLVSRISETLDRFSEEVAQSEALLSVSNVQMQIDKLRAHIFADFPMDESLEFEDNGCCPSNGDMIGFDADAGRELAKARERVEALETEIARLKKDGETVTPESGDTLAQATDQIAHLEGRVRELVDRENRLNAELERMRLTDYQHTLEQNQQILSLRAEVDTMRKNEVALRESLDQMTVRCDERLSEAKAGNMEAVEQLSSMLQDNQSELLSMLTELNTAKRQLDITAGKLDERSAQLDDALRQVKTADDSVDEMRQSNGNLRKQIVELESQRDLLSERVAAYEHTAVDGVVGAEELIRQTSDLEKHLAEKDGSIIRLELLVSDLQEAIKNAESREEALVVESDRLRQQLDSATTDQVEMMAGLHSKVQIFEQVIGQRDKEIAKLRGEIASRNETGGSSQLSGGSFGKIVAASVEVDPDRRLARLQDIFRQMNATHADEISSLNKQLEQADSNMQLFKEHAKKQFEEQQEKVCMHVILLNLMQFCVLLLSYLFLGVIN